MAHPYFGLTFLQSLTVGVLFGNKIRIQQNPEREGGDMSDDIKKLLFIRSKYRVFDRVMCNLLDQRIIQSPS